MRQTSFLKKTKSDYGGDLRNTRKGRRGSRPLSSRTTMHLVLRSTKAKGDWSFRRPAHEKKIRLIIDKFSQRYGVRIVSLANVGNHLHFQIKLSNRHTYKPFIRAITAAIAMAVTGSSRWKRAQNPALNGRGDTTSQARLGFWDRRPWTRIVESFRGFLNLRDYIQVNQLEGIGLTRPEARWLFARGLREADTS